MEIGAESVHKLRNPRIYLRTSQFKAVLKFLSLKIKKTKILKTSNVMIINGHPHQNYLLNKKVIKSVILH
jgi:hypothetical protein